VTTAIEFQLPENLTIAYVQGLHEKLEVIINDSDHDKVVLQGKDVSRADTAGVQLLLAFVNSAKERQVELYWEHPSEKLLAAASVLGLQKALGIH